MDISGMFNDCVRDILWGVASLFLFVLDFLWSIVLKVATLDLSSLNFMGDWFALIGTTMVLFVFWRLSKILVKAFLDPEEYMRKINISKVIFMIGVSTLAISLAPLGYQYLCSATSTAISEVADFIPGETKELKMSDVLIQSGRINMNDSSAKLGKKTKINKDFDINEKEGNDYVNFPTYASLFLIIILSIMTVFIFFSTALMIAQRIVSILLKYLLAPYAISGLIDPQDQTFSVWMKMIVGDLLTNFFQIYATYFIISLCNNSVIQKSLGNDAVGVGAQILIFLGALSAVQNVPAWIARIIGGSGAGSMQALQDLKTVTSAGKGLALGAAGAVGAGAAGAMGAVGGGMNGMAAASANGSGAAGAIGNVMKGAASGAVGASGLGSNLSNSSPVSSIKNGLGALSAGASAMKSGAPLAASALGAGAASAGITAAKGMMGNQSINKNSPAFNMEPTNSQMNYAEKMGIDGADDMSRGELSQALEEAGADQSYWHGYEALQSETDTWSDLASPSSKGEAMFSSTGNDFYGNMKEERMNDFNEIVDPGKGMNK